MKKRLISIMICIMMLLMIGCGSDKAENNSAKDPVKEDESQTIDKDFSIEMTDDYTFTDPQDLDFNQRFVLVGDENSKVLSDMANFGLTATKMYDIFYAKDGVPVGEYQYFVTPDEASATALNEFYSSQGQNITQEGNVIYAFSDGDTVEAMIIMFASTGAISAETPEAYIEMMKSFNGLMEY